MSIMSIIEKQTRQVIINKTNGRKGEQVTEAGIKLFALEMTSKTLLAKLMTVF